MWRTLILCQAEIVIGRDLGTIPLFKEHLMEWDNATTPKLDPAVFIKNLIDDLEHELSYISMILKEKESKQFSMQSIAKLT